MKIVLMIILLSTSAFAVDTKAKVEKTEAKVEMPKKSQPSLENRKGLKHQITIGSGHEFRGYAESYNYGQFRDGDKMMGLKFSQIKPFESEDDEVEDQRLGMQAFGAWFRKFIDNSRYVQVDVAYMRLYGEQKEFKTPILGWFEDDEYFDLDWKGAVMSFRIGNQWQWENFTVGCDWIGVGATYQLAGESKISWPYTVSFLNFQIGASF